MDPFINSSIYPQSLMEKNVFWFNTAGSMITLSQPVKIMKVVEVKFSSIWLFTQQVNLSLMVLILHQLNMLLVCMLCRNLWLLLMLTKDHGVSIEKEASLSMLWTMILSNLKSLMSYSSLIVLILLLLTIGLEDLVSLVMPTSLSQIKLVLTDWWSLNSETVCSLLTSNGLKVENQSRLWKFNSSIWKKNYSKLICLYLTLLSSLQLLSIKISMCQTSSIGKLRLLWQPATSILSKSTFILIWQVLLPPTKSPKSSIDMVSIKLRTISKHSTVTLLLLKDYLRFCILSTGIANLYLQSMILKKDGLSMTHQVKINYKLSITQEQTFLLFSCWEDMLWMMEDAPLIGTLHSPETHLILSED